MSKSSKKQPLLEKWLKLFIGYQRSLFSDQLIVAVLLKNTYLNTVLN